MPEFLHELVKKREERDEWRTLMPLRIPSLSYGMFRAPSLEMPSANTISYTSVTLGNVTEHSIEFPNVGGWIQSTVCINTPASVAIGRETSLYNHAWELLAGHPCRPNYTWSGGTYTCRSCSGTYNTIGMEWSLARV